ncbi:MAG: hypothetical protein ABR884_00310 [Minisyncoccia bacterium]|jgi:hypothetical protein
MGADEEYVLKEDFGGDAGLVVHSYERGIAENQRSSAAGAGEPRLF